MDQTATSPASDDSIDNNKFSEFVKAAEETKDNYCDGLVVLMAVPFRAQDRARKWLGQG
jgi:hypothetical protein